MRNQFWESKLSPAQILISFDPTGDTMAGKLYSGYYGRLYRFYSETDLILEIDRLCDSVQFPQASYQSRSFETKFMKIVARKVEPFTEKDLNETNQEKATFLVHIQFRQNATWQGSITWVEKEKTQNFRSALEMLKLMDEARHPAVKEIVDWRETLGE